MKLIPNYQTAVLTEETYLKEMERISQQLRACRQEGTFAGFDGKPLYYEYFQTKESRGAIVVAHGLSEFTQKYHEFAWYLLNQGYDVFLYDQRCHGRSCRLTDRPDLIHVDHFTDYRKDLHCFVENVVRKATDLPLYLYAHSMGGAVALQYLACHPGVFQKAILSAPMIAPLTGSTPPLVARWGLSAYVLFGNGRKKFWFSGEFDPEFPFARSHDKSFARFSRNMEIRISDASYRTTPQTIRWVQQSLTLKGPLTRKSFLKKIQTPIRMLCAEKDTVVCEKAQEKLDRNCKACQRFVLYGAAHGMLCGTKETIEAQLQHVLDHFC